MNNENRARSELVRVSVLFTPPPGLNAADETPGTRYQKITQDTHQKLKSLLRWLKRNRIVYSDVSSMDALSTVFLNIPRDAIASVKSLREVDAVDEEVPMQFDPL